MLSNIFHLYIEKRYNVSMKIFVSFLAVYVIVVSSISVFYSHLLEENTRHINKNQNEIHGVEYLKAITTISTSIARYEGESYLDKDRVYLEKEILQNIDAIYHLQKKYPKFINNDFNDKLQNLKKFNISAEEYYAFLDYVNHENYRIGDVSELLFELNRKTYFLVSLITHYLPEYLISTAIAHNIVEELIHIGYLSDDKTNLFLEQTKLVYLSAQEINEIIGLLSEYEDTTTLSKYINEITEALENVSNTINLKDIFVNNSKVLKRYIELTHPIIENSYKLNEANTQLIFNDLKQKDLQLNEERLFINLINLFIFFVNTSLFALSYRLYVLKIKENKNLEKEKEKTQQALEFKSRFLSNMSHEIRTPLNAIIGLTHVVTKTELSSKQEDIIHKIKSSSELLLGVINDILDISKIEAGKMQIQQIDFNLHDIIEMLKDMFSDKIKEKNLYLNINYIDIENFYYLGDSLRITQILTNFMSNAVKFTSSGGIDVFIKSIGEDKVVFEVKDTGIGIKPEQQENLCDDFVQAEMDTSRKYGGTGLGLSISKNLIEMMGGSLRIESEYKKGSSFIFEIPLYASNEIVTKELENLNLESLEERVNNIENKYILVAEDNKMNQTLLSLLLEDSKLNIDFAGDGKIAVDMYNKNKYDLILMDIQMPNLNGYEATEIIRKKDKVIPIIALSANIMKEDIDKAYNFGMNTYLTKPIEVEKLYIELLKNLDS